jgi:hypothetical protein
MADLAAIVFVRGKTPGPDAIDVLIGIVQCGDDQIGYLHMTPALFGHLRRSQHRLQATLALPLVELVILSFPRIVNPSNSIMPV